MRCGAPLTSKVLDDPERPRLACTKCPFVFYNNPTPVVGAIVEWDDQIVMVRNVGWPEHIFGLVTGFLEAREDPAVGVVREVKEELNLDVDIVR